MTFVYEVNGQKVEFEKEPTEADIDEAARTLGTQPTEAPNPSETSGVGVVGPALTGYGYGAETGLSGLGGKIAGAVEPIKEAGSAVLQGYSKSPLKAVADMGAMHIGLPPPYATATSGMNLYNSVKAGLESGKNFATQLGSLPESARNDFNAIINSLKPSDYAKFANEVETKGISALKSFQLPEYAKSLAPTLEGLQAQIPGTFGKIGQVVGPIARGAARVAGPVGMGMNLYDAGQMARETQLGQRLQQGQGQVAEQAYRNGLGMTYQGPQLSSEEAQNVLRSGSQRDIKYFGGEDNLTKAIRRKAAEKVLGPVQPGSF